MGNKEEEEGGRMRIFCFWGAWFRISFDLFSHVPPPFTTTSIYMGTYVPLVVADLALDVLALQVVPDLDQGLLRSRHKGPAFRDLVLYVCVCVDVTIGHGRKVK
jgi:hypothetical protein